MAVTISKEELLTMVGHESEPGSWLTVDQEMVNRFAEATLDRQFIHVDPERAAATPFGGTVAHGFLTLSLLPHLMEESAVLPEGLQMVVNYGLNRVRFPRPVKVGSRIRLRSKLIDVAERLPDRIMVTTEARIEIEGEKLPGLVAETLTLLVMGGDGDGGP